MLAVPNLHATSVLLLTAIALILFSRRKIPLETTSLLVLVALLVGFTAFPYSNNGQVLETRSFFSGFGHEALIAVCSLMIIGHGVVRTGALEPVGLLLARVWGRSPRLALLLALLAAAFFSAFVNNTPIVILMLPVLVTVSMRSKVSTSQVLMPVGFATLLGGMSTTIGTSTNLLVVSVASDLGLDRFSMFDFLLPASIAVGVGILYLWLVVPLIMPERTPVMSDTSPRVFNAYLFIPEGSFADGKSLSDTLDKTQGEMSIQQILRDETTYIRPLPDARIMAGDQLGIRDTPERLKEFERTLGATLYTRNVKVDEQHPLADAEQQIAEIVVTQGSLLENNTLRNIRFKDTYQLVVLALHRAGVEMKSLPKGVMSTRLYAGDVILVQGGRKQLASIRREGQLLMLDATSDLPFTHRASYAIAIMAAVVLSAALGWMPISVSATSGVALMILTRCLNWRDVGGALSTSVVLVIVASLALATALQQTGGADYLALLFLEYTRDFSATIVLSLLMLLMAILTNVVSNNAAAVVGTPIAVSIATELGLPVEAFVLAVLFGANMSFATPMAYQTNLLVMNTGGYVFSDFLRAGVPLVLLIWLTLSVVLPMLYGF
ncbi:SLC13 family permease [Granulosicoccus antarcticus]|uniref:RCK C-terminal domain-containing protein n=1 Tax=Granulosicoccus antarcticus IMCC3135 TaxID=1192854 RepID=A0A2Z2NRG5_9GAMM|nr:SLC13 family permease [Granulosicoccus antarcticus]ASJ73095.1 hypothetical protein IMCC3135_15055 [Granulosicoccus antarcticus IMCC3135]